MSEALRYQYYNMPAVGGMIEVDPRILEYHPCRRIWNMTDHLAQLLWTSHLSGHSPIRVRTGYVIDGTRRVQASIQLGLPVILVALHT